MDDTGETSDNTINRCYQQIFFHAMESDREPYWESQLRTGSITVRDFVRGLLLSERFYRGYVQCNNNERLVEQVVGRVLGRPIYNEAEKKSLSIKIAVDGFSKFIDYILDCDEYMEGFGYNTVPSQIKRKIPGKALGETPIYQVLPRYAESWRDQLISQKLMMSIDEHNRFKQMKLGVSKWLYEKPKGLAYQAWILGVGLVSAGSIALILKLSNEIFTIR